MPIRSQIRKQRRMDDHSTIRATTRSLGETKVLDPKTRDRRCHARDSERKDEDRQRRPACLQGRVAHKRKACGKYLHPTSRWARREPGVAVWQSTSFDEEYCSAPRAPLAIAERTERYKAQRLLPARLYHCGRCVSGPKAREWRNPVARQ